MAVSIDAREAHERYGYEPVEKLDPETLFERQWALTILERAMSRLSQEFAAIYSRAELEQLRTTEGAVKKIVHRLRRRYGQLLRDEIAATVADPGEIDSELRHLLSTVRPWEPPTP